MTAIKADVCSNCKKPVPDQCDGNTFRVADWSRQVCKGSDGDNFFQKDGSLRFRIVMGHGTEYDVEPVPTELEVQRS